MNLIIAEDTGIQRASTDEQIRSCHRVMRQLRPHLTEEQAFVEQVQRQLAEGYHLVYCQDNGGARVLAGFRFLEFLAWGKVLYIDDLITDSETRRSGHGGKLLKWVIEQGKKAKCAQVHPKVLRIASMELRHEVLTCHKRNPGLCFGPS